MEIVELLRESNASTSVFKNRHKSIPLSRSNACDSLESFRWQTGPARNPSWIFAREYFIKTIIHASAATTCWVTLPLWTTHYSVVLCVGLSPILLAGVLLVNDVLSGAFSCFPIPAAFPPESLAFSFHFLLRPFHSLIVAWHPFQVYSTYCFSSAFFTPLLFTSFNCSTGVWVCLHSNHQWVIVL